MIGIDFVALVGLLGAGVSYQRLPRAIKIVICVTLSFSVFYVLTSRMLLPQNVIGDRVDAGIIVNYQWIPAAIFGAIGFIRPSFGLLSLHYMLWQKQSLAAIFWHPDHRRGLHHGDRYLRSHYHWLYSFTAFCAATTIIQDAEQRF